MQYEVATFIDQLENKVEAQIAFAVDVLQNLSDQELTTPSSSGGWSIVEILDHLNSYGAYYLPLIQTKIDTVKASVKKESFKSGMLGNYFAKMISPGTKKIKAAKIHLPKKNLNPAEVVMEFIRQEELFLQYLFKAREVDLEGIRIPISIAKMIRLKLGDILLFVIHHVDRHFVQANILLSKDKTYSVEA
jgi:uncharacterized damage-inducible protein DinB